MKKKQFKFKGVVLACCLAAAMPLGMTTPFEINAVAQVGAYTVDITPSAGVVDKVGYVKTQIEGALAGNDVVRVTGQVELDASADSIEINIPQGKKLIWEASITGRSVNDLLKIKSTGTGADFEMVSGSLKSEAHTALSAPDRNGNVNFTVKGGEIISGIYSSAPTVKFKGEGHFNMTGGKIINYGADYALSLQPKVNMDYNITGGTLIACGTKNTADFVRKNEVIGLVAPSSINTNVNVDAKKTNIICWDKEGYNNRIPLINYVSGYDKRDLKVYPGSSTEVSWVNDNGVAAIRYTNPTGESGMAAVQGGVGVENIDFPSIVDAVYDKAEHGLDNAAAPDGSNIEFKYKDADGNISSQKPVNAGEYEVSAKLSATYGDYEVSLGKLKIDKRPVTVEVPNKEIKANEDLPNDFSDYTVTNLANGDNKEDAIMSTPAFTWGTDGKSVGEFNVSTVTPISYKDNYKAAATALKGVLKVKAADVNPGTQPKTPEDKPKTPENKPKTPEDKPKTPEDKPKTPEDKPKMPEDKPKMPEDKPKTPENKPKTPEDKPKTPEGKPQQPKTSDKNKPVPDKATPSVPKKPDNSRGGRTGGGSGGGKRSGRDSGGSKKGGSAKNKNTNTAEAGTWISDAKGWWYKEANGSYPKLTWKEISYNGVKSWYYFDEQGYMATGWRLINGKWYYMYEKTEKQYVKGSMAYNTNIGEYKVGSDGAWIK